MSTSKPQPRDWYIPCNPFEMDDEEQIARALSEIVTILSRLGGSLVMVGDRQEVQPGMFVTVGFQCRWESYAPARRFEAPAEDEAAAEESPVEVAA